MKWKVVGWADYDDSTIEDGDVTFATREAIKDEMRAKGLFFSGRDHQESWCCAPVLNDGKRRCFSQRGWGALMAELMDERSMYSYAGYTYGVASPATPDCTKDAFDCDGFSPETDLAEGFNVDVTAGELDLAMCEHVVKLPVMNELRYLDAGDSLTLSDGTRTFTRLVTDVDQKKDLTEDQRIDVLVCMRSDDEEESRRAGEEFNATPVVTIIKLSRTEE